MLRIGSRPDVRLFTITQGGGINAGGRFQMFGARKGVADICGVLHLPWLRPHPSWLASIDSFRPPIRQPSFLAWLWSSVGIGIPLAFEVKVGRDRLRPEQQQFLDMINRFGGIGREVRSVADCMAVLP